MLENMLSIVGKGTTDFLRWEFDNGNDDNDCNDNDDDDNDDDDDDDFQQAQEYFKALSKNNLSRESITYLKVLNVQIDSLQENMPS